MRIALAGALMLAGCAGAGAPVGGTAAAPRSYECAFAVVRPTLDGRLDEGAWEQAEWTADFIDIEGDAKPRPSLRTRAKMLWDEAYLFIAAEMEEPHLWAEYTKRDEIVFHQHDFEAFIDPDGDTREYYELEANVLKTIFDLYLHTAYRDGGPAVHAWDATGLVTAVQAHGTPNDPRDLDEGWTLEWAIPWGDLVPPAEFRAAAKESARQGRPPAPGDTWRINFSRVEWPLSVVDGKYVKGSPEWNWVWSPQGMIDMHQPERWGHVRFAGPPEGSGR